jgi:hypothetical protein
MYAQCMAPLCFRVIRSLRFQTSQAVRRSCGFDVHGKINLPDWCFRLALSHCNAGATACTPCKTCCSQAVTSGSCSAGSTADAVVCTVNAGYYGIGTVGTCLQVGHTLGQVSWWSDLDGVMSWMTDGPFDRRERLHSMQDLLPGQHQLDLVCCWEHGGQRYVQDECRLLWGRKHNLQPMPRRQILDCR